MRGEKLVNEPDGSLGLAFSEIESGQLIRSHLIITERRGRQKAYIFVNILSLCVVMETKFRHERELAKVRLRSIRP